MHSFPGEQTPARDLPADPARVLIVFRCLVLRLILVAVGVGVESGLSAFAQAPPNDNFANAQIISGQSGRVNGSNVGATLEPMEPVNVYSTGGKSIWYQWTAAATNSVRFDTVGSSFDTVMAVYYTNASGALVLIGPADNPNSGDLPSSGGYLESRVNLANAVIGRTHFIVVDGYNPGDGSGAANGAVQLNWNQIVGAPANDDFGSPIVLTGSRGAVSGRNHNATKENNEPNHAANPGGRSVWFSWTAPANGEVVMDTFGSTMDTLLAVYTGSKLNNLTVVAQNDDAAQIDLDGDGIPDSRFISLSRVTFSATSGVVYRIAVDGGNGGFGAASGSISLHYYFAAAPPTNDNFANAALLTGIRGHTNVSNLAATRESREPSHTTHNSGHSIWFHWMAPTNGQVTFDTFGYYFDSVLAVYTGGAIEALTPVVTNDDVVPGVVRLSRASFAATAGTPYRIAVSGGSNELVGATGDFNPFTLNWEMALNAPTNDLLANAQLLPGLRGSIMTSNTTAVFEQNELLHGGYGGKSLWFKWTSPYDREVTFDTGGSSFDTLLAVYAGTAFSNLVLVANNDDVSVSNRTSRVTFNATNGTPYLIAVDGYNAGIGRGAKNGVVILNWQQSGGPPPNDNLANAFALGGFSGSTNGTTVDATTEPEEPDLGLAAAAASTWFRWTAPSGGWFTFDTLGSAIDTVIAAYTSSGTNFASFLEVASNDNIDETTPILQSRMTFRATAGTVYWIAVDGGFGARGDFVLHWAPTARLSVAVVSGNLRVTLTVTDGDTYTLQSSTDLKQWTDLQSVNAAAGPVTVNLGPVSGSSRRFFRARQ